MAKTNHETTMTKSASNLLRLEDDGADERSDPSPRLAAAPRPGGSPRQPLLLSRLGASAKTRTAQVGGSQTETTCIFHVCMVLLPSYLG